MERPCEGHMERDNGPRQWELKAQPEAHVTMVTWNLVGLPATPTKF